MRIFLVSCLVWAILGIVFVKTALGAPQCSTRDEVLRLLDEKYDEQVVSIGVTNVGGLLEVLASKDGKTFSIIITSPKGTACLVAAGEGWKSMKAIKGDAVVLDNGAVYFTDKGQEIKY